MSGQTDIPDRRQSMVVCHCSKCEENQKRFTLTHRATHCAVARRTALRHHRKRPLHAAESLSEEGRCQSIVPASNQRFTYVEDILGRVSCNGDQFVACRCCNCCMDRHRNKVVPLVSLETCLQHCSEYGSKFAEDRRWTVPSCGRDVDGGSNGADDIQQETALPFQPPESMSEDGIALWDSVMTLIRREFTEADLAARLPGQDGSRLLHICSGSTQDQVAPPEVRQWLCQMLNAKTQYSLSNECLSYFCKMWKTSCLVEEDAKQHFPEDLAGILSAMAACGMHVPCLYVYDICDVCAHVFRQVPIISFY